MAEVCRLETDPTGSDPLRVDLSTYYYCLLHRSSSTVHIIKYT